MSETENPNTLFANPCTLLERSAEGQLIKILLLPWVYLRGRGIQGSRQENKWARITSIITILSLTPNKMPIIAFWKNCISKKDSLEFPRHFHQWKNSIIWIGTLRGLPRAGKSLWNQNVLRRRSSHRSGRTRQPCSTSAWWGPCGRTGWPTPCGREQRPVGRPRVGVGQS